MREFDKKRVITIAVASSIGIAILLAFVASYASLRSSTVHLQNPSGDLGEGTSSKSPNDFSISWCTKQIATFKIVDYGGFSLVKSRSQTSENVSYPGDAQSSNPATNNEVSSPLPAGTYEFVLKPGTKAFLAFEYNFCPDGKNYQSNEIILPMHRSNLTELFSSFDSSRYGIYKLDPEVLHSNKTHDNPFGSLQLLTSSDNAILNRIPPENISGVAVVFSNVEQTSDFSAKATYILDSSQSTQRATYVTLFYERNMQILTIGNEPNEDSAAITKGQFYG